MSIRLTRDIARSILFQLSLKYEPSSIIIPRAIIFIIISKRNTILKIRSAISKTKIEIYPSINVFNINRMVESMIIAKIKKSNTLLVAIFMQTTLN